VPAREEDSSFSARAGASGHRKHVRERRVARAPLLSGLSSRHGGEQAELHRAGTVASWLSSIHL
jgi:hypothetical protein